LLLSLSVCEKNELTLFNLLPSSAFKTYLQRRALSSDPQNLKKPLLVVKG
jgi:hypothetical protein